MKELSIKILIISRSRWKTINKHAGQMLPEWIEVLVPESEKEAYEANMPNPILTIPDEVEGLGQVRNWVLDNFKEETVIMVDDDVIRMVNLSGIRTRRVEDREEVVQAMINTAIMSRDMGVHFFGYSQTDIRKFNGTDPFKLNTWVGCVVGINGRKYRFRNDKFKVDIDYALQNLLTDRIIFCDNRYYFYQERDNNKGGNSLYRTEEDLERSMHDLEKKWSPFLTINRNKHKNNVQLKMNVPRRQVIKYD